MGGREVLTVVNAYLDNLVDEKTLHSPNEYLQGLKIT